MKRIVSVALAVGVVFLSGFGSAYAQDKKVEFSLNVGAMTVLGGDISFGAVLLTLTPQVDILVAKGFLISPEVMFLTDTRFSGFAFLPGLVFNYLGNGFFVGGGAVVEVSVVDDMGARALLPKLNIGYRGRHVKLTAYLITFTEAMFSLNLVGVNFGIRF